MPSRSPHSSSHGPFRADQVRSGDRYEISDGHAIYTAPTGGRGSRSISTGVLPLETDPAVTSTGVDTGFSPRADLLRAPDIAVGNVSTEPGWVKDAPPLAVEYADVGQDEPELQKKIAELLEAGTRYIWVVRLVGPRRVEIYEAGATMRVALPGEELLAPGILRNAVRVEALYDPEAAREAALRNLLQRKGYESLEGVHVEGKQEGKALSILTVLRARGFEVSAELRERILGCRDEALLDQWLERAVVAKALGELA
jgi:Uma2 family endonuclease